MVFVDLSYPREPNWAQDVFSVTLRALKDLTFPLVLFSGFIPGIIPWFYSLVAFPLVLFPGIIPQFYSLVVFIAWLHFPWFYSLVLFCAQIWMLVKFV